MADTIGETRPGDELTPREAERAIYVDFEGTETDPPSFLGALRADDDGGLRFVQYVLEQGLWPAASGRPGVCGGALIVAAWADLAELAAIAETEDRRVVAWSGRERDELVLRVPDEDGRRWFADNVFDAKPAAKRWRSRAHPDVDFPRDPKRPRCRHRLNPDPPPPVEN
jgi:hypothetical protein